MKRALFKIGNTIYVESKTKLGDHFSVSIDVETWRKKTKIIKQEKGDNLKLMDWSFNFQLIKNNYHSKIAKDEYGTYIEITNLKDEIMEDFDNSVSRKKLKVEIEKTLAYSLGKNLHLTINSEFAKSKPILLLGSDSIKPYYKTLNYGTVTIDIYAGVGNPFPDDAGWYIYCNDRLMISANKENLTGWEGGRNYFNDTGVQKYHNKVAMFRGLVFFSSKDSKDLPMTTTKTGIDSNSHIYKSTREYMIEAMKIVLEKLNEIEDSKTRKEIVQNSVMQDIKDFNTIELKNSFQFPDIPKTLGNLAFQNISYKVDKNIFDNVKNHLGVDRPKEVGVETFNYFVKMNELD